jgi:ATP-binding cassette subfamily B multidrug efflux pump
MLRLIKYLKPYVSLILISVILLFVQANSDLALPDYMSKIVNYGIQQGGVENVLPIAIRQSEMNKVATLLSTENKALVFRNYDLIDKSSIDYDKYQFQFPTLAKEPIYILKSLTTTETHHLEPVMGKALVIVSFIQQAVADPAKAATIGQGLGLDLSKIPPSTDIFSVLSKIPNAQLAIVTNTIDKKISPLGESMVTQMAISFVKAEYTALGLDTTRLQTNYIIHNGILMLLFTLLSVACTIVVGWLSAKTAAGLSRDLRKNVFQRVGSFSNSEFDKFSTASLITRTTNDVTQIQMVVIMMMRMVIYAPIIGVGGVIRAIGKSTSMWWLIGLAVVVLLGLILTIFSISLPKFKIMQKLIDRLNLVTRENLSGMMVIRAFNMQTFEEDRFDKANIDLTSTSLFVNRIMVLMMPVMMLVMNGLSLLIIWVGSHQVAQSTMLVGDMMAFMQYALQIVFAFLMMSLMFIILPRASVSADRIAEVLETEPVIKDPVYPKPFSKPFKNTIEFKNVSFRYPDAEEDILHEISFIARPGQTTAFIGTTGSGKSTIVSLIPRFYNVTSGTVRIDGIDIREVSQHDLRDKIGYVPQKSNLFSGTIESNLRYADENASEEELILAADIAQANEFIATTPEGMQGAISQGGTNVSGGQKQRLAIARALVKKAPIYIFDDSFSALDFKTDSVLRKALKKHTSASTILIVTQRISTIINAEQIIVLDEGRIAGKGTHKELMQTCEVYRGIALAQLSAEELV